MASKAENVAFLTTNCTCLKGQEAALNAFPDEAVQGLADQLEALADHAEFAGTVRNTLGVASNVSLNELNGLVVNMKPKKGGGCGDDDDDAIPKKPTMNQWLALMPEEAKATWNSAVKQHDKDKAAVIERLLVNVAGDKKAKEAAKTRLQAKTLDQLEEMAMFLPPVANTQQRPADYTGAAGGGGDANVDTTTNADEDGFVDGPLPTINHTYMDNAFKPKNAG